MFSITSFCTLPWSSIVILPSGDFRVCCFGGTKRDHGIGLDEQGQVMNVTTHSIEDALNSTLHKSIRLAQSQNIKHPACDVCWRKEASHLSEKQLHQYEKETDGAYSYRIGRTFKHGKDAVNMKDAEGMMMPDGSITNTPISLDLRFSNLCNAKCIQCDPRYSSLWYNDHIQLTGSHEFDMGPKKYKIIPDGNRLKDDTVSWHDHPIWWEQFDRIKHHVRQIYITGGEPFLQKAHGRLLDILNENDLSKNIRLRYDTNLTVINDQLLSKLEKFKEVRLGVSVDDVERRYELIRYPCSWKRLNQNLEKLKNYSNIKVTITNCVGVFNFYTMMRVISHFQSVNYNQFSFRLISNPSCYDLAYLPQKAKVEIINTYENSNVPIHHKSLIIGYLKNTMNKYTNEQCNEQMRSFRVRMDKLDELRGTDWKETFPEVYEVLNSCQ